MIDGARLRHLRENNGYSRKELAKIIDAGEAQVARYERGQSDITSDVLARIAKLFGVSADYLLGLTDKPAPQVEHDLRPEEIAIIEARRRGDYRAAMKILVADEN
jgi:transcriptional regulator with XRE-family HTH domain